MGLRLIVVIPAGSKRFYRADFVNSNQVRWTTTIGAGNTFWPVSIQYSIVRAENREVASFLCRRGLILDCITFLKGFTLLVSEGPA